MAWRYEVMDASTRPPLRDVLDRQGGAVVGEMSEAAAELRIEGLEPYTFYDFVDDTLVSQGDWSHQGSLLECCAAVAARHPGEG